MGRHHLSTKTEVPLERGVPLPRIYSVDTLEDGLRDQHEDINRNIFAIGGEKEMDCPPTGTGGVNHGPAEQWDL